MTEIITSTDIEIITAARQKATKWAELSDQEVAAYTKIHNRLAEIAEEGVQEADRFGDFTYGLTSSFSTKSGVRGNLPKDLWFALRRCGLERLQARDLRRTAIVLMGEAGCTEAQIAAVSGHSIEGTRQILETYLVRTAKMGRAAIRKWEESDG